MTTIHHKEPELPRDAYSKAWITNWVSGSTGPISFNMIKGVVFKGFVLNFLSLGRPFLGVLHILGTLPSVLQFLGAYIVQRTGKKRNTFILFGLLRWLPILFIFLVPFISPEQEWLRRLALGAIVLVRGIMGNVCAAAWNNMMNDIVPSNQRGRFWSMRSVLANVSTAAAVWLITMMIDWFKAADMALTGYFIAFGLALVLGAADALIHLILPEKTIAKTEREAARLLGGIRDAARGVFRSGSMRAFLFYYSLLTFQANLFMLTFQTYALDKDLLGLKLGIIGGYMSIVQVLSWFGYLFWGRVGDLFGYKVPILFNLIMRFGMILPWLFITNANLHVLIWVWIIVGGFFNVGIFLNTTAMMHGVVPEERRAGHMAFLMVVPQLCGALAGGAFFLAARLLAGRSFSLLGIDLSDIRLLFLVILILNVLIIILALFLPTRKGQPAGRILQGVYMHGGLRTFINVMITSFSIGEEQMAQRAKQMGAMENPIAVNPLIKGLEDPSFRVRQESAWALGRISHAAGRKALERVLENPDAMIHDEAVWSLGKIGDARSVEVLRPLLESEDAAFRARVVLALGDIRSDQAVAPLVELLENESNAFVRECIFDSLAILQDHSVLPELVRALACEKLPRARRHMAMSVGIYLDGRKDEFYKLLSNELENRGSLGNGLSARIRNACRRQGHEEWTDDADRLGDLFWKRAHGELLELVLDLFARCHGRKDQRLDGEDSQRGEEDPAIAVLNALKGLDRGGIHPGMSLSSIALYSLLKVIEREAGE